MESYDKPNATLTFQLPRYEVNRKLMLLLHNLDTTICEMISLPLPELAQLGNTTGIDTCFPEHCLSVEFTSLPVNLSATIPLRVDLFGLEAGKYELKKWVGGIVGSEQRISFTVSEVTS